MPKQIKSAAFAIFSFAVGISSVVCQILRLYLAGYILTSRVRGRVIIASLPSLVNNLYVLGFLLAGAAIISSIISLFFTDRRRTFAFLGGCGGITSLLLGIIIV